jgi:hypothetical protein
MKKLALAIGFGAYIVFGASGGTLAHYKADGTALSAASIAFSETGTSPRLLFVNQQLYPDAAVKWDTDNTYCVDGNCISR